MFFSTPIQKIISSAQRDATTTAAPSNAPASTARVAPNDDESAVKVDESFTDTSCTAYSVQRTEHVLSSTAARGGPRDRELHPLRTSQPQHLRQEHLPLQPPRGRVAQRARGRTAPACLQTGGIPRFPRRSGWGEARSALSEAADRGTAATTANRADPVLSCSSNRARSRRTRESYWTAWEELGTPRPHPIGGAPRARLSRSLPRPVFFSLHLFVLSSRLRSTRSFRLARLSSCLAPNRFSLRAGAPGDVPQKPGSYSPSFSSHPRVSRRDRRTDRHR